MLVNGKAVKASYEVKKGDVLELLFGQRTVKAEVLDLAETTKKEEAKRIVSLSVSPCSRQKQRRLSHRRRIFMSVRKLKKRVAWSKINLKCAQTEEEGRA